MCREFIVDALRLKTCREAKEAGLGREVKLFYSYTTGLMCPLQGALQSCLVA